MSEDSRTPYNFLKAVKKPIWCNGCGLFSIHITLGNCLAELGWDYKNTVLVSGIGCSGRASGYYNTDGIQSTHGRAIPLAEGIKLANPELNVVVFSGDGDLLGIGGNHMVHAARRNTNITVICNRNEIYGMTGGQLAPTTPAVDVTKTSPAGSGVQPLDFKPLITSYKPHFFARTSITDTKHLKDAITAGLKWKGFAYIEVMSMCPTNHGRDLGFANPAQMLMALKEKVEKQSDLYKMEIDYDEV